MGYENMKQLKRWNMTFYNSFHLHVAVATQQIEAPKGILCLCKPAYICRNFSGSMLKGSLKEVLCCDVESV